MEEYDICMCTLHATDGGDMQEMSLAQLSALTGLDLMAAEHSVSSSKHQTLSTP